MMMAISKKECFLFGDWHVYEVKECMTVAMTSLLLAEWVDEGI